MARQARPPSPTKRELLVALISLSIVVCVFGVALHWFFTRTATQTRPKLLVDLPQLPTSPPLVSVITPTKHSRHKYHKHLYDCFNAQTYPNKELLVLDEGNRLSEFFSSLQDPRVRYIPQTQSQSVGLKRNTLVTAARGEIIAHFDDDDHYSEHYLQFMVGHLLDKKLDLITLSGFFLYARLDSFLGYWDKTTDSALVPSQPLSLLVARDSGRVSVKNFVFPSADQYLYGFGFTYVYRKDITPLQSNANWAGFDDIRLGEDFSFVQRANTSKHHVGHVADTLGLAIKSIHKDCSSNVLSQYRLPAFVLPLLFGDAVEGFLSVL